MSIGTAKPSLEEQAGIKHYFVHSHSAEYPVSAADFEREALEVLEHEFKNHETIILVGGSGMFIDALCDGLDDIPNDANLRDELTILVQEKGLEILLNELKKKDVNYYKLVDKSNPVRIIRAIEAIRISGKTFTELRQKKSKKRYFEIFRFVIDLPREKLYERINLRTSLMFENNLVEEVKNLIQFREIQTLNTVGYSEVFDFLDGKITLEKAIELVQQNSRRYAKRQLTWFRRNEKAIWLKSEKAEDLLEEILGKLKQ